MSGPGSSASPEARRSRPGSDERGAVGIGILLAVALTFVVAAAVTNAFVNLYGQAVVRSAIDEGIRAGTRLGGDPAAMCEAAGREVLESLIPGPMGDDVTGPHCAVGADGLLVATATATFPALRPFSAAGWTVSLSGSGALESGP